MDLIRLAWRRLGWPEQAMTEPRWTRLGHLATDPALGRASVGAGVEAVATPDRWTLRRLAGSRSEPPPESCPLKIPGSVAWSGGRVVATLDLDEPVDERVDLDPLEGPLLVRPAQPGDQFAPLGLAGRSQPLSDFFRGRKVARSARAIVPVVADARGIVWVAGHRIAHRVRQTEATTRTLGLRFDPEPVNPEKLG